MLELLILFLTTVFRAVIGWLVNRLLNKLVDKK